MMSERYCHQIVFLILDLIKLYNFTENELKISATCKTNYILNFMASKFTLIGT